MANKIFQDIGERIEGFLRRLVGRITPDKRVGVILTMLVLFGGLSLYMTISSIYNLGRNSGKNLRIERIESLRFQSEQARRDSINHQNNYENDRTNE